MERFVTCVWPGKGVGGYTHCDTGEEGKWRPPLLYANP